MSHLWSVDINSLGLFSSGFIDAFVLFFLGNLTDTDLSMTLGSIVSGVPLVKSQRV